MHNDKKGFLCKKVSIQALGALFVLGTNAQAVTVTVEVVQAATVAVVVAPHRKTFTQVNLLTRQ
jgi:hypothetical protein